MKRIASRAGVLTPLLHHHFETRKRLLQSAIAKMAAIIPSMAAELLPQQGSVVERLDGVTPPVHTVFHQQFARQLPLLWNSPRRLTHSHSIK